MAGGMDGKIRLAYYGDDFTGSTDTLAAVVAAGWRAALFLDVPDAEDLARFGPLDCVGVAGTARAMSAAEMDHALPRVFRGLADTGAAALHYKTCSTFDSAPHIGSIGHAVSLLRQTVAARPVFIVGGQPNLGRYCAFANLYARAGQDGPLYRIDRHPTMSRHPVTPMDEADLRLHLARQGLAGIASFDVEMLEQAAGPCAQQLDRLIEAGADTILFDVARPAHLERIGSLLWQRQRQAAGPLVLAGPTSVAQALLAADQVDAEARGSAAAALPGTLPDAARRDRPAVHQTFIVAGSRSSVTAAQIGAAEQAGFLSIALDPDAMARGDGAYVQRMVQGIVLGLRDGRSVVAHTTLADAGGLEQAGYTRALATSCGLLMSRVLQQHPLERVGLAGGDTSSLAVQSWGARALTFSYALSAGVAVCRVHAPGHPTDGVELMLKGGQMGPPSLFHDLLGAKG
jgi:uncharacterized protein YgbK (DUF1537 family)